MNTQSAYELDGNKLTGTAIPARENPDHGFGHKSDVQDLREDIYDPCKPGCRYYEKTGRVDSLGILSRYKT